MLKELDDLEKAVGRMIDKARIGAQDERGSESDRSIAGKVDVGRMDRSSEPLNEEAAELIKRAIKRLKSL